MNSDPSNVPARLKISSRRRFLRGVGVCLALPALETFLPRRLMAAATSGEPALATTATGAPLRSAFIYFPNGAIPASWAPSGTGKEYVLSETLAPLAELKDKIQVFGGLTDLSAVGGPDGGGDHARATGTFLTGVRIKKTGGKDFHAGISVDQVMAQQVGLIAPFRSLELSCDSIRNAGACDTGYSCVYQHNLAWSSPTTPVTPEINPRQLFERLFGAGTRSERKQNFQVRVEQQRSILDFVRDDSLSLEKELSGHDRDKLDEYCASVRDIEQRLEHREKFRTADADAPAYGVPRKFSEYVRLMYDMLHLAFQSDCTRIATFMLAGDGSNRNFSEIGVSEGHHSLSHHRNDPETMKKVAKIDHWYVEQLAYFLAKMESTKDVDGNSLLHNSMIVYGSGHCDGNRHTHVNLPIILAGAGGGALTPGRYVKHRAAPMTNLYLSLIDRTGVKNVQNLGDSTGRLSNI
jgi:hypothetical protein